MTFTVAARTLLHLGAELISSDGIAFYELIKNGLDALRDVDPPSEAKVRLIVVSRLEFDAYETVLRELGVWSSAVVDDEAFDFEDDEDDEDDEPPFVPRSWQVLLQLVRNSVIPGSVGLDDFVHSLNGVASEDDLAEAILAANYVEIVDEGVGMSHSDLSEIFLRIGTTNRVKQRISERRAGTVRSRPLLGEKGLGRLSAMRLGDKLNIRTARKADVRWNILDVDWMEFAAAGDADLTTVVIAPVIGGLKLPPDHSGTTVRISGLKSEWTYEKLEQLATSEFAKLTDPFSASEFPVQVTFNGRAVPIPKFADFIFSHAHGVLSAKLFKSPKGNPVLKGTAEYKLRDRKRSFRLRGVDLSSIAGAASKSTLKRVGPFDLKVYWFNRRLLTKIEGIGDLKQVRALIERWGGGVMVFRDGFRVHPYGGPDDDWLDLDREAFSTSGFKVNRGQLVGKVDISHGGNPYLVDQTNREGLRDSPEKAAFVAIIANLMDKHFRQFLNSVDDDIKRADKLTLAQVTARVDAEDEKISEALDKLTAVLPKTVVARELTLEFKSALSSIKHLNHQVRATAETYDRERLRVIHLASVGLMVEVLAHELWRATASGLRTIAEARNAKDAVTMTRSLAVLDAQMRTLQKRLKTLDPLSTNSRQVREKFDVVDWVRSIVATFSSQARRERIQYSVRCVPRDGSLTIEAVKGMFVQVIENLLVNSVYWIEQQRRYTGDFEGSVEILIDCDRKEISVTDNGPGIPRDRREIVFEPFFSTKPKKEGRGLGLYISREIAEYHGGKLYLSDRPDKDGQLRTFIFEIKALKGHSDDE
ncbi:sensor histidine kinase [Rhizobium sp. 25PS6]|uniref:sensor histidine kinase n=1 Tax=Rhizobium sp. 25PS6 TaxID=3075622 RepID=UPI0028FD1027|nr:sensor histidine kinase [Rhizobium sp. 25PS6]MDU0364265.1 sensor histidine kinase [Rhizobium sp. 25PS6]